MAIFRRPAQRFWRRMANRRRRNKRRRSGKLKRGIIWAIRIAVLVVVLDIFYLSLIWPDWSKLEAARLDSTAFIDNYKAQRKANPDWPPLRWHQVRLGAIPKYIPQAVIVAEDGRFYEHSGFDLQAFKEAMTYNLEKLNFKYGASTISQQVTKNLFLTGSRNPLRKWHELVLTMAMERNLSKRRILELYVNIAEFGKGIYGVAAAARYYYGVDTVDLSRWQSAELAASLPSPRKHNPHTRTKRFERRAKKIYKYMSWVKAKT